MIMSDILELSLVDLSKKIKARELSPVDVANASLARIAATEDRLNAYVLVLEEDARAAAKKAEDEISRGEWKGPLHGVPVAVKDLFDLAGTATTSSSRQRTNWMASQDSAVVEILRNAGAVILGKTHTHEFAAGIMTPTTRNPWDTQRTPGGSSGGSGATVASCGAFMAIGTDTGGSIRIPASVCGIVGLKPTWGRVSRYGSTPLSWGLDHTGPLVRTVEDAAASLQILAGYDARDPGTLYEEVPDFSESLGKGVKGLRVGVPTNYFFDHINPEVEAAVRAALQKLESLGAELVEVTIPMAEMMGAMHFGILLPEASAYHRHMLRDTPHLYGEDVRAFLEAGELMLASDYVRSQQMRSLLQQEFKKVYEKIDVMVAPSVPTTAVMADTETLTWADGTEEPMVAAYTRYSTPVNLTGLPALNVTCGFSSENLPIGMQVIGRPLAESTVLQVGAAYQAATDWHTRHPEL
jgi:aspartyl-tRNA(Asn)/glutamyl-tRNA(Gln) amidotransferase subunit A